MLPVEVGVEGLYLLHHVGTAPLLPALSRRIALVHLRPFFIFDRVRDITSDRIGRYIESRQGLRAAPATIRYELACLRRAFTLALRAGKATHVPDIPNISVDNARKGFFEPADFAAVEQELPEALRMLMRFLYLTGWRAGEALGLTWAGVDFGGGVVRLEPGATKNGEGREFPFLAFPQLAELLHKQREQTSALEREQGRMIAAVFHRNGSPIHFPEIFQPRLESQLRAQVAWDRFESRRQINYQSLTHRSAGGWNVLLRRCAETQHVGCALRTWRRADPLPFATRADYRQHIGARI